MLEKEVDSTENNERVLLQKDFVLHIYALKIVFKTVRIPLALFFQGTDHH